MDNNRPLLDPADTKWLESRHEIFPARPNRFRMRRDRFHDLCRDEDSSLGASVSSPSSSLESTLKDDDLVEVPVYLHSVEAYMIIGFDEKTAHDIFQIWTNMDRKVRDDFADFFKMSQDWLDFRHIDAASTTDDWDDAMRRLGINDQLRQAILKPGFDQVRLTKSALSWIHQGMGMRWDALELCYDASRERARAQAEKLQQLEEEYCQRLWLDRANPPDTPYTHKKAYSKMFKPCRDLPGDLILWKATGQTRLKDAFCHDRSLQKFDVTVLTSSAPTDFSGKQAINYFTPQVEGAQHYCHYLNDIAYIERVCIVRIAIPNRIIEQARPLVLQYPSDIFRQTVWYSRNSKVARRFVPELVGHKLLIGHVCKGTARVFSKMVDWKEITEENLVKLDDGTYMTQYAFEDEGLGDEINENCQGKVKVVHTEKPEVEINIFA